MSEMIKAENVSKEYRLGTIGGATLKEDLQSWLAKVRGKDDPNKKIGTTVHNRNERFLALNEVTFSVEQGEALGIIGHNGSGKSTLLKLISRVTAPTKGSIYLNGRIASMLEVGTGFHPELTGRENVYLNGAILGMSKSEINKKFDAIVAFSELEQFIDTPVKRYSSGMYVKLAFSVAAHLDSEIMIMDEVLAVGDVAFQKKCLGRMGEAANKENRTVLYVSHNMSTIKTLCTKCMVLDHGKAVFFGDVDVAINKYIGLKASDYRIEFDLNNCKRFNDTITNSSLRMISLKIVNKEKSIIHKNEIMKLQLYIKAKELVDNIEIMMIIYNIDGTKMGRTDTPLLSVQPGINILTMALPTKNFPEGSYYAEFNVFRIKDDGFNTKYDSADEAFTFHVESEETTYGKVWNRNLWGHTVYDPIEIISIEQH